MELSTSVVEARNGCSNVMKLRKMVLGRYWRVLVEEMHVLGGVPELRLIAGRGV